MPVGFVQTLSHYRVVRRLGTGGMGEVYLAQDTELERSVALKVMSPELAKDANQRKRFRTEAKAASSLSHPNICVIHEVGETEDGRPFLAMEYVDGQTLESILKERRVRIREAIGIGVAVAEALEAAHARSIVHRDIKTANIMLDRSGRVKVLDFGLAKRFGRDDLSTLSTSAHTRTGVLIGTPHYMSPEQVLGRDLDARTDIFSLGALLYEIVAGQKPFRGQTIGETINSVVNQQPDPLGLENPLFSPTLDGIIFKCLEKDPAKRYPSAKAVAEDLARLKTETERAGAEVKEPARAGETSDCVCVPRSPPPGLWSDVREAGRKSPVGFVIGAAVLTALVFLAAPALFRSRLGTGSRTPGAGSNEAKSAALQKSIAVLPFDNYSAEADTEYLSDGLTEEITTALSRIRGLKVAARNSAFAFKGKKEDVRRIGEALRVNALLEGSVRKVGKQLRVTAQLINVADGYHLWSETFDRSVDDIIAVQEEIARRIAERLQGGASAVEMRKAPDAEAHKFYLQGRLFWNKRTEAGLRKSIQLFQQAIEKDPGYAEAHAGLASAYILMPLYALDPRPNEYRALARAAVDRALELNPACAEAHVVLAELQSIAHNYEGAEEHFRRALQLNPNFATGHHWYGRYLNLRGRRDEGLAELKNALDLDPLSPVIHCTIPEWYYMGGDYDRAIEEGRKVIDTFPDFPLARTLFGAMLLKAGRYPDALAEIDRARALQPDQPLAALELRGYCLARSGQQEAARTILAQLEQERSAGKNVESLIAYVYLGLREQDRAMDALERAVARNGLDESALCDPLMQEFCALPRFQELVRQAGLKKM